tara:strand:+ start:11826 stop:12959 length:1134 start_codon:yes stop_codon:yes gene_type:complete
MKQRIVFGNNKIKQLRKIIETINPKTILILTGNKSYNRSGSKKLIEFLIKGYKNQRFYNFSTDPKYEDVKKGVKLIKEINPELIIAVGGGSVIDMAKQINILSNNKYNKKSIIQKLKLKKPKIPLIAIPTTSGTGSESTSFSVIYINGKKYSIEDESMMPNYAFILPKLGDNMTKSLLASCVFDAFSQAIESYWSINSTTFSKRLSSKAIKIIKNNLIKAINGNVTSKAELFKAANLSGQAINITKTTAPHAISYTLSSKYKIRHGHAVALTLGKFFRYNNPDSTKIINDKRGQKYLQKTMNNLYKILECKNSAECEEYWYKTMRKIGLKIRFKNIGIKNSNDIHYLVKCVDKNRLSNNPISINKEQLTNILDSLKA